MHIKRVDLLHGKLISLHSRRCEGNATSNKSTHSNEVHQFTRGGGGGGGPEKKTI
jgi:hypothetical protein